MGYLILLVVIQLEWNPFLRWTLKGTIKSLKKKGKMGYSPEATLEFLEDSFLETTPDNKTEQRYEAVERISVLRGKAIYIHVNSVMAYILPMSCFESPEEYEAFLAFVKRKCPKIATY